MSEGYKETYRKMMTVQELLDSLMVLDEKKRKAFIGCHHSADCAWTLIYGIDDNLYEYRDGVYLRLQEK